MGLKLYISCLIVTCRLGSLKTSPTNLEQLQKYTLSTRGHKSCSCMHIFYFLICLWFIRDIWCYI